MIEWDSRVRDNHSVKILKAVIPFFDVEVGEHIDMEGLLTAVRPFARDRERRILDMILQFFQMQRMMDMVQMIQSMQQMQEFAGAAGEEGEEMEGNPGSSPAMFDMLKAMIPPEQQDMAEMLSAMMMMSDDAQKPDVVPEDEQKEGGYESVDL